MIIAIVAPRPERTRFYKTFEQVRPITGTRSQAAKFDKDVAEKVARQISIYFPFFKCLPVNESAPCKEIRKQVGEPYL